MDKAKEISKAKKRRAKMLVRYEQTGGSYAKLAKSYKITPSRVGQLIRQAQDERASENKLTGATLTCT